MSGTAPERKVVLAALATVAIAFLVVLGVVMPLYNNHVKKAADRAAAAASAAAASGRAQAQQDVASQTADVEKEGIRVVTAVVAHTPAGTSPRSVPLSDLPQWLPELASGEYQVLALPSYATAGRAVITGDGAHDALARPVCVTVPDRVVTSAQIAAGHYVGAC